MYLHHEKKQNKKDFLSMKGEKEKFEGVHGGEKKKEKGHPFAFQTENGGGGWGKVQLEQKKRCTLEEELLRSAKNGKVRGYFFLEQMQYTEIFFILYFLNLIKKHHTEMPSNKSFV